MTHTPTASERLSMLLILAAAEHDLFLHEATAVDTDHILLNYAIGAGNINVIAAHNLRGCGYETNEFTKETLNCHRNLLIFLQLNQPLHDGLSIPCNHVVRSMAYHCPSPTTALTAEQPLHIFKCLVIFNRPTKFHLVVQYAIHAVPEPH